jgi:hypothetical protein
MLASYNWAHSIDTSSAGSPSGNNANYLSPGDVNQNRGPSDFDIRHAFSAGLTYDIPSPKFNAVANALLRGWSLESLVQARSASAVNVTDENFFELDNGGGTEINVRPDLVPGQAVYLRGLQYPGGKALNPAAFTDPPSDPKTGNPLRQGNVARNSFRGFGATQWDFAVHREFPIHDTIKLQFRSEMFNVVNHPNFGQPYGAWPLGGFGLSSQMLGQYLAGNLGSSAGALSPLYQIGGPRSIQLALKLTF